VPIDWVAEHTDFRRDEQFVDRLVSGPARRWVHTHRFRSTGPSSSIVEDSVDFEVPFGPLGRCIVRRQLPTMFAFRHRRTHGDLVRQSPFAGGPSLRIAITGSSGVIGRELVPFLTTAGHRVERLVRRQAAEHDEIAWDPSRGWIDNERLEGVDAVVHLAGESIKPPWTRSRRRRIRESRTDGTRLLSEALARLHTPPRVLVSASGINYYGERGDAVVDEAVPLGAGFLASLCADWERATAPASAAGVRVVTMRNGVVLSARGGALPSMVRPFKLGLGGRFGSGEQYVSWIAVDDLLGAIYRSLHDERVSGPINAAAPNPVTNAELTETLGRVLRRPTVLPVPAIAVRIGLGGLGDELLLTSIRAVPRALEAIGFRFDFPMLEDALRLQLGRAV
jgi:uncharacterized protein (TIGR01777 family)